MVDLLPPQNTDVERTVLASCLTSPVALNDVMGILDPADFYSGRNRVIYEAMRSLWKSNKEVNAATIYQVLKAKQQLDLIDGGIGYVTGLTDDDLFTPGNAKSYAEIIKNKSVARSVQVMCQKARQAAQDGNAVAVAQKLCAELTALSSGVTGKTLVPASDFIMPALDEIGLQLTGGGVSGIPTGFKELDMRTAGLHRGDLIIVKAKTSVGKSAFAGCVAEYIARHEPGWVLYFSVEMSSVQLVKRMVCREAEESAFNIDHGNVWHPSKMFNERLTPAAQRIDGIKIMLDHHTRTVTGICSQTRGFALREQVDLVVVDYAQRVRGNREKGMSKEQEMQTIGMDLRWLAIDVDVPVMLLSQVNKEGTTRESEALENDTDCLIKLTRETNQSIDIEDAEAFVEKQRNGPLGPVPLLFNKPITRWQNPGG